MSAIRESIESTIKKIKLKKRKCRFARCSKVSFDCKFEGNNFIDRYAKIVSSSLGYATYVGHNSSIEGCNVGRYTCIGPNVRIIHGNHPVHEFVSIHPAFFSLQKQAGFTYVEKQKYCEESYVDPDNQYYVKIENDVWICDGASILAGLTIGNGAVVAANALVTKDVPPYAIVAGVPAKIIGKRFEEEQINYLLSIKWWERDKKWLKNNCDLFADISTMMKELKKNE